MKKLRFVGSSLDDLKQFPPEVRREAGFELDAVQRGFMPQQTRREDMELAKRRYARLESQ